jgi:hypothetical protein
LDGHDAKSVDEVLKKSIEKEIIVISDKSNSYVNIADNVEIILLKN